MTKKFRPMLAAPIDFDRVEWPLLMTPKIDGIRVLIKDNQVLTRSLKPVPNANVRKALSVLPNGLDGELVCGTGFNETSSLVMSHDKPIHGRLEYVVFDSFDKPDDPYNKRIASLQYGYKGLEAGGIQITYLSTPFVARTLESAINYLQSCLAAGYEGAMGRHPYGPYKYGRSTANQGYLLKLKEFHDDEATIIALVEKTVHIGPAKINALGLKERDAKKENRVLSGTLGALVCDSPKFGKFEIGTGFSDALRLDYWKNPPVGKLAKFKYFEATPAGKPRFPVFLGLRDPRDLS